MSRTKKMSFAVGLSLALAALCVLAVSYYLVTTITGRFVPSPAKKAKIERHRVRLNDLGAEPISFESEDGIALEGLLLVRPKARRVVLLCHGYRMTKELMLRFVQLFPKDSILIFDFRGHGESGGAFVSAGRYEYYDVSAAVDVIKRDERLSRLPIVGLGISMGSVALLSAARYRPEIKAVVADSPFARLEQQIVDVFVRRAGVPPIPFVPIAKVIADKQLGLKLEDVNTVEYVQDLKVPLMIIHAEEDQITPCQHAVELHETATSERKELWIVQDATHVRASTYHQDEYCRRVNAFFKRYA